MPLFRSNVKQSKITGRQRIEKGMSVDVVTSNPGRHKWRITDSGRFNAYRWS